MKWFYNILETNIIMQIPDVASEALNYGDKKMRSMAARAYRTKINSLAGNSYSGSASTTIEFMLPSNLSASYLDMANTYLRFTLNINGATSYLDKGGVTSIFNKVEVFSSGSQICTINNYNLLASAMIDTDASLGYRTNIGKVLMGTSGVGPLGEYNVSGASRTYAMPLALLPMSMQKKLIPLFSLDSIRIRFTLENPTYAFISSGTVSYTVTDPQLTAYITELSPSAQVLIDQQTQGKYQILCPCFNNIQTSISAGVTSATTSLGISVSSLEKILVIHRHTDQFVAGKQTLGNHITNGLASYQFSIDSQLYPQNPILVGTTGASEALAELLLSSHEISNFRNDAPICAANYVSALTIGTVTNSSVLFGPYDAIYPYLNIPATSNTSNPWNMAYTDGSQLSTTTSGSVTSTGSFVASIELENGTSWNNSAKLYSGLSTLGSVVMWQGQYSGSGVAGTIDFFCYYTIMLTLDMRGTGTWLVSV